MMDPPLPQYDFLIFRFNVQKATQNQFQRPTTLWEAYAVEP